MNLPEFLKILHEKYPQLYDKLLSCGFSISQFCKDIDCIPIFRDPYKCFFNYEYILKYIEENKNLHNFWLF